MIAVVGPGAGADDGADPTLLALAEEVGVRVAQSGHALVTGGLGGVMAAASLGAAGAGGQVLALLPGDDVTAANPHATLAVATGLGQGRNLLVVRAAEAVIGVGGSWGTLSEIAIAMRLRRPVVWLRGWTVSGPAEPVLTAATAEDAVSLVLARIG